MLQLMCEKKNFTLFRGGVCESSHFFFSSEKVPDLGGEVPIKRSFLHWVFVLSSSVWQCFDSGEGKLQPAVEFVQLVCSSLYLLKILLNNLIFFYPKVLRIIFDPWRHPSQAEKLKNEVKGFFWGTPCRLDINKDILSLAQSAK